MKKARNSNELIKDKEVAAREEDKLGHDGIVEQLESLVLSVPTPTNIALYGAWGSGKSGIANLLKSRIEKVKGVKYARFDAFKYAENPLRRNFVAAVAHALDVNEKKFHDDLYMGSVETDFNIPFVKMAKFIWVFILLIAGCALVSISIASIIAAIKPGEFWANIEQYIGVLISASLVPASILTALVAFVGKTFVVQKNFEKANSDEQFERLFSNLVERANVERLVIFVDELDRCSPDNVVATLDAVRTFLGVNKCIFIIASDQQVLERALTKSVQQATPIDTINPYYSAGSSYLDKVFQYHISVPPLLPQSITRFAADLVAGRSGLWGKINTTQVVSILVPSHVRSPRRVKNLLNSFVIFYKLAESRRSSGNLDSDIETRAEEIAKLVCFNVEFPLFSRDLVIDHKLPEYVLGLVECHGDSTGYWSGQKYVTESIRKIAEAYADLKAPASNLLIDSTDDDSTAIDSGGEITAPQRIEVEKSQGRQLIEYLSRTRRVQNPRRDIIHLQSAGYVFGLDSTIAESLEMDAQNGAVQKLKETYGKLDAEGRKSAISFLLQQERTAVGVEQDNIAISILVLAEDESVDFSSHANLILDSISIAISRSPNILNANTLKGAWRLSLVSDKPSAEILSSEILAHDLLEGDLAALIYIIASSDRCLKIGSEHIFKAINWHLMSDEPEELTEALERLDGARLEQLFNTIKKPLSESLSTFVSEYIAAEKAAKSSSTGIDADVLDPQGVIDELISASSRLIKHHRPAGEALLTLVLDAKQEKIRNSLEVKLGEFSPISSVDTVIAVLENFKFRISSKWPLWIDSVDKRVLASIDIKPQLKGIFDSFWDRVTRLSNELDIDSTNLVLSALAGVVEGQGEGTRSDIKTGLLKLSWDVAQENAMAIYERETLVLKSMVAAGLVSGRDFSNLTTQCLIDTLNIDFDDVSSGLPFMPHIISSMSEIMKGYIGEDYQTYPLSEELKEKLILAAHECTWIPESEKTRILVHALSVTDSRSDQLKELIPDASEIESYIAAHNIEPSSMISYWISISEDSFDNTLRLAKAGLAQDNDKRMIDAISTWQARLSSDEKIQLIKEFCGGVDGPVPAADFLKSIGFMSARDSEITALIVSRFRQVNNNQQRRDVLELWKRAELTESKQRKVLVEKVLIPCIEHGDQSFEIALDYMYLLVSPAPVGTKRILGECVLNAAEGRKSLMEKAQSILSRLGIKVKRSGWFSNKKIVAVDDDRESRDV